MLLRAAVHRRVEIAAHTVDEAWLPASEATAHQVLFLFGEEAEAGGQIEHLVEQAEAERMILVCQGMEQRRK